MKNSKIVKTKKVNYGQKLQLKKADKIFILENLERFYNIKLKKENKEEIIIYNDLITVVLMEKPRTNLSILIDIIDDLIQIVNLQKSIGLKASLINYL